MKRASLGLLSISTSTTALYFYDQLGDKIEHLNDQLKKYPQATFGFQTGTKDPYLEQAQKTYCLGLQNIRHICDCERIKSKVLEKSKQSLIQEAKRLKNLPDPLEKIRDLDACCVEATRQGLISTERFYRLKTYSDPMLGEFLRDSFENNRALHDFTTHLAHEIVEIALEIEKAGGSHEKIVEILTPGAKEQTRLVEEMNLIGERYRIFNS